MSEILVWVLSGLGCVVAIVVFVLCTIADNATFRENEKHGGGFIL